MQESFAPLARHYHVDLETIFARVRKIDPQRYERERNHLDGAATWLSPFIAHGIISTRDVAEGVLESHPLRRCEKLFNELGWREFFHRTWQLEGERIFEDLKQPQDNVRSELPPRSVLDGNTGIDGIDVPIRHLIAEGTMHNHARLWTAAVTTRFARTWWAEPARWLHYHLLDGDLASNHLSWQWVAGTSRAKPYVMNQDNVNRFAHTRQHGTWLDVPYERLDTLSLPREKARRHAPEYHGYDARQPLLDQLPGRPIAQAGELFAAGGTLALRSVWNLDPRWREDIDRHAVFIDVEQALDWPMSAKRWALIEHWAAHCDAQIVYGSLDELYAAGGDVTLLRREYPACDNWPGECEQRDWLYPMPDMPFPSFTKFWKQVRGSQGL